MRGALAWLVLHQLQRLGRENLLLRALAWPGLLCSVALLGTVLVVGVLQPAPRIRVDAPALVEPFREAGFVVDAAASGLRLSQEAGTWVLSADGPSSDVVRAESVLRDAVGAPWRISVPMPPRPKAASLGSVTGPLAGLVAILFTLYGVVLGAAAVHRDRQEGVLDAELALPLPRWMHGVARLAAAACALCVALTATLLMLDAFLSVEHWARWSVSGTAAASTASAIGVAAMAGGRGDESFSSRLSRALTAVMALLALGWASPTFGGYVPVSSLSAMMRGAAPGPWIVEVSLAVVACAASARWFERQS